MGKSQKLLRLLAKDLLFSDTSNISWHFGTSKMKNLARNVGLESPNGC